MSAKDWIPIEWVHKVQERDFDVPLPIVVHRMVSPFYPDVRYAVRKGGWVLNIQGEWEWEPSPGNRDDAFYEKYRFKSFETAILAAEKVIRQ